jgi:hypothetical protein
LIGFKNVKSASVANCRSRCRWLKTDFVVGRISDPLLAAEVSFRCLNADVSEQELNLFKLPACLMTQTGAGTTKIVRRKSIQTALRGPGLHDAPDHLRAESVRSDSFEIPAAVNQRSTATLTRVGTGTVRT